MQKPTTPTFSEVTDVLGQQVVDRAGEVAHGALDRHLPT